MIERGDGSHVVVTPNTVSLMRSQRNDALLEAYRRADMAVADGIGLVWAAKTLGLSLSERIPGIALAEELLRQGNERGYRVFLLGGREGVAVRAKERLLRRFPNLEIVGARHGYFEDEGEVIDAIGIARPDILLVGMGVPRQELFMMRIRDQLSVPLMIGVGGALDIFSGDRTRAPRVWQGLGLEWLYRLLIEPHRLRDAILIPRFMLRVLWARATRFRPDPVPSSMRQIDSP
ncbi:MAG TPA: glycosyltransferase [Candidatus Acetothermia bacterium]|nr:glycosyltransferase [Candidatus Acetothermia bacterium]